MSAIARNFVLGLVSLIAVAGLVFLLFRFGELETLVKRRYQLTINCTNASGLRAGSTIELNGVPIGLVDRVENTMHPQYPVRILALVDSSVRIPEGVVPYATSSLLGGSATLQFESPPGPNGAMPADGKATISGDIRSRLVEEFTDEIDVRMQPVVEAMQEFRGLARNLNELVRADDPDRPGELHNIRTTVETLNQLLIDLQEAVALTKGWLGDQQLQADTRGVVSDTRQLINQATETMSLLAGTLEDVRVLARRAGEGDGTVAQLLNNPDLYKSLDDAAIRLERTLRDIQLLVEKIKDDGLPVIW